MTFPFRLRPATRPKGLENQHKSTRCENGVFALTSPVISGNVGFTRHEFPGLAGICQPRLVRGFGFLGLGFSKQLTESGAANESPCHRAHCTKL